MKQVYAISTAIDENATPVITNVTIDFDGFTLEHAQKAFFTSTSPRVLLQQRLRKLKSIPSKYEVKALDLLGKAAPTVRAQTPAEMIASIKSGDTVLSDEDKANILEMLGVVTK